MTKQWLPIIVVVTVIGAVVALAAALVVLRPSTLPLVYLWFKAFHVIAVISWMAGMLYLPRLFVYHCSAETGSRQSETFKVMERRLLRGIMTPAMIATWVFGLWIMHLGGWSSAHWLHAKLALVVALSGIHGMLARWTAGFAVGHNRHSERFYRVVNEVPALLMVGIVILVVIKPF